MAKRSKGGPRSRTAVRSGVRSRHEDGREGAGIQTRGVRQGPTGRQAEQTWGSGKHTFPKLVAREECVEAPVG